MMRFFLPLPFLKSLIVLWHRQLLSICISFDMLLSLCMLYLGKGYFLRQEAAAEILVTFLSSWVRACSPAVDCWLSSFVCCTPLQCILGSPPHGAKLALENNFQSKMKECGTEWVQDSRECEWRERLGPQRLPAVPCTQLPTRLCTQRKPIPGRVDKTRSLAGFTLSRPAKIGECCVNGSFYNLCFHVYIGCFSFLSMPKQFRMVHFGEKKLAH